MVKSKWVTLVLVGGLSSLGLASCTPPTAFEGSAQFPGGALGCFKQCQKVGMEMASYVYVGEYSTACACKPKVAQALGGAAARDDFDSDEASVVAASAGVESQRRLAEEQRRAVPPSAVSAR